MDQVKNIAPVTVATLQCCNKLLAERLSLLLNASVFYSSFVLNAFVYLKSAAE